MGGTIRRRHDGEWFHCDEGKSMLGLPQGCAHGEGRGLGAKMDKWEQWAAVLPVAVGHGILSLLLLEELCDGQQLFQDVLNDRKSRK